MEIHHRHAKEDPIEQILSDMFGPTIFRSIEPIGILT